MDISTALWKIFVEVVIVTLSVWCIILVVVCRKFYKLYKEAKGNSITDHLTNLYNVRYLEQRLKEEIGRARRCGHKLHVAYIDLDNFKMVNDTYGHDKGDYVLKTFAGSLKQIVRGYDILARIGGDEFVLIMPEITTEAAKKVGEKIIQLAKNIEIDNNFVGISASIGIKQFESGDSGADLLKGADDFMFFVKKTGKGRVCAM